MFTNSRYVTRGITETVPLAIQLMLWNMIDTMNVSNKDYLQVFELYEEDGKQKIIHKQEQPEYERTYSLDMADAFLYAKIFVIDDETHSTMLLASEY